VFVCCGLWLVCGFGYGLLVFWFEQLFGGHWQSSVFGVGVFFHAGLIFVRFGGVYFVEIGLGGVVVLVWELVWELVWKLVMGYCTYFLYKLR
jgi:hypothetical protein